MLKSRLRYAYLATAGLGTVTLLIATFFDTAPEGTHNLGLLQTQMLWFGFAAINIVVAAILFVGAYLGGILESAKDVGSQ